VEVPGNVPESINCHSCGAVIDLAGQTGFTHVDCRRCGSVSVVPVKFGGFLLLNTVGVGGMGTVYKAVDLSLNRYLALKILRPQLAANPEFIERFTREARAAAAVNHPNVAQVYSFGERDGQYYLAMELLERGSLDDRIVREGKLSEKEVLEVASAVASGLRAAWQRGLLHRDIKPGNILFTQDAVPKIVDFGLARLQSESTEAENAAGPGEEPQVWGTPYYIAPEKLRGHPDDFRSDMYSLGATLFHALAGRPPFEAETADEVVSKQAEQPAYSLKTYAPTTQDFTAHVIARMLAKNPAERYGSYDELTHELHEAQAVLRVAQTMPAIVDSTGQRISFGSILGTVAAIAVCGIVVWFAWRNRQEWFGLEKAVPASGSGAVASVGATDAGTTTAAGDLEFPEDESWMKAWNTAALQLAQGRFTEALLGYDNALQLLGPNRPEYRRWVFFFQGLTLLTLDRPAEADRSFYKAIDPRVAGAIPETITAGNLCSPLAAAMLRGVATADLEAAEPRMEPWAAALTRFTIGFKYLDAGEFTKAAEAFRAYHKLPCASKNRWAFNLQPLAPKLASRCDEAAATLARLDTLQKEQGLATAIEAVRAAATNATLTSLKTALLMRETELDKALAGQREEMERTATEVDRQRREVLEREREQAAAEKQTVRVGEAGITALWDAYAFATVRKTYETLAASIKTTEVRQLLQTRLATARLLEEFKTRLAADFVRRPLDGQQLRTRDGAQLSGKLGRATDTQLIFTTPYGELTSEWRNLTPAAIVKVGEFYATAFAATEKTDTRARRYLLLAVFCKQYGLDRGVTPYLNQARQLQPALPAEAEWIFGDRAG
jgi:hypothetical protein